MPFPSRSFITGCLLALFGCADDPLDSPYSAEPCPGSATRSLTPGDLTRTAKSGGTEYEVSFTSLECAGPPEALVFRISLTNHSGVSNYDHDPRLHARILTDDGAIIADGMTYEVLSTDDHHPAWDLAAPAQWQGSPVIGCATGSVSFELSEIGTPGGDVILLSWTGELLEPLRSCSGT